MRKLGLVFAMIILIVGYSLNLRAEPQVDVTDTTEELTTQNTSLEPIDETETAEEATFHQVLKRKFIEGGVTWMTPILIVLIFGLALVIERTIYLNLSRTNTKTLLDKLEDKLNNEGVEAAKELCRSTRGPIASVCYQGLDRINEDIDVIEKSIVAYGGVQMGRLENNLIWLSLFIAIAPMLGFLGTVIGMVQAFDDIEKAGDISPTVVAGGMKVALLTTVFGLITGIILQVLYNYLVSMIENIVNKMEDASISFMDILVKYKRNKNI